MPRKSGKLPDKPVGTRKEKGLPPMITEDEWETFFHEVSKAAANVTRACEICRISRVTVWNREKVDPVFATRLAEAKKLGIEVLEEEAHRRAFEGVPKKVGWFQGVATEVEQNYSDALIQFLLKANKPEKFVERSVVTTNDGGPGGRYSKMSTAEIDAELEHRRKRGGK